MWKLYKILTRILKAAFWLAAALAVAVIATLLVLARGIPAPLLARISEAASTDTLHTHIGSATFSLHHGLRARDIRLLPKHSTAGPILTAGQLHARLDLWPATPAAKRIRKITLTDLSMPHIPKGLASPHDDAPPAALPPIGPFHLTLENPDILGIQASKLSATLSTAPRALRADNVRIWWPDSPFSATVAASATLDLDTRLVHGLASGQALPTNILPLLEALKARAVITQINCFTDIERPITASADFTINIDDTDFLLLLDVALGACRYRGVPFESARGAITAYGTNIHTSAEIDITHARAQSGPLSGRIVYREETEGLDIQATSAASMTDLLHIINLFTQGELDLIRCHTPPTVTAAGAVALSATKSTITNALSGTLAFERGTILGFSVQDASADLSIHGHSATISNVSGTSDSGGAITGDITFHFPEYAATATVFTTHVRLTDVDLPDITDAFNVTNSARTGLVSGAITLAGSTHRDTLASLNGSGSLRIRHGLINQMRLFAGLTDFLARNIPGISSIVNQSTGSLDFTVTDGILTTDNLLIESDIISIRGRGTYHIPDDKLDFTVRVNIFRRKTIAGRITHFITYPFTRLLLEFKLFGSLADPNWSYINIVERITDTLSPPDNTENETP